MTAALQQLEREHFLEPQGHGRRSRIDLPKGSFRPAFRVTLLPFERADLQLDYAAEIQRQLKEEDSGSPSRSGWMSKATAG